MRLPTTGLWNSVPATLILEALLFAGAIWLYTRATRPVDAIGRWGFWGLVAALGLIYVASAFGPPPPGEREIAIVSLTLWLFVPWGWWVDHHRLPRSPSPPRPPRTS